MQNKCRNYSLCGLCDYTWCLYRLCHVASRRVAYRCPTCIVTVWSSNIELSPKRILKKQNIYPYIGSPINIKYDRQLTVHTGTELSVFLKRFGQIRVNIYDRVSRVIVLASSYWSLELLFLASMAMASIICRKGSISKNSLFTLLRFKTGAKWRGNFFLFLGKNIISLSPGDGPGNVINGVMGRLSTRAM